MDGHYASRSQLQRSRDMIFDLNTNFEIAKEYLDYSIMKSLIGMNNLKLRTLELEEKISELEEKNKDLEQRIKSLENIVLELSKNKEKKQIEQIESSCYDIIFSE